MMVLVLEDDFEFILVTFHWCQSSTTLLMICTHINFLHLFLLHRSPLISWMVYLLVMFLTIHVIVVILRNHRAVCVQLHLALVSCSEHLKEKKITYVQIHEAYSNFHKWDCSFEHSQGCTRTFGCGGCPPMQQSGVSLSFIFECLLYDLLSFLTSRFPDRSPESSEPYVTLGFRSSLNGATFGVHTSFFPDSHVRVSRTHRILQGLLEEFLSHRYAVPRDETTCACFHLQRELRAFLRSFHWNEFVRKDVIKYRVPSFPAISIQLHLFLPRMFWLFSHPLTASYISSRRSFVQKISLGNKEWFFSRHASWTLVSKWWQ